MGQMKEEQQIIWNAWLKTGFEWFNKREGEGMLGVLGVLGMLGMLGGRRGLFKYKFNFINIFVIIIYYLIILFILPGNYCHQATPVIFMKRLVLHGVAAGQHG